MGHVGEQKGQPSQHKEVSDKLRVAADVLLQLLSDRRVDLQQEQHERSDATSRLGCTRHLTLDGAWQLPSLALLFRAACAGHQQFTTASLHAQAVHSQHFIVCERWH